ncbi:MAG: VTC domain-containing protein [Actinomycetota bacterium]
MRSPTVTPPSEQRHRRVDGGTTTGRPHRDLARQAFTPIGLEEAMRVELMSRLDTKVAVPLPALTTILERLAAAPGRPFRLVATPIGVAPRYTTLYFDTADLRHYLAHHNGRRRREKYRYRHYHSTGATFFEVKRRSNARRTSKERVPTPAIGTRLDRGERALIGRLGVTAGPIRPTLEVIYDRMTLVGTGRRVTIDLGLRCRAVDHEGRARGPVADFGHIAVLEVKETRRDPRSPVAEALREHGLRPHGMSKYCLGVASCIDGVRRNGFERRLKQVREL